MVEIQTWRHIECGAAAKIGSDSILGGKAEIRKFDGISIVHDQDVLRFQIPVEDTSGVAMLDSVKNLKENPSRLVVDSNVVAILCDLREQIAFWTIL